MRGNAFGHAILSNVGSIGIEQAFANLNPPVHHLGAHCTGKMSKRAVVVNDEIVIRPMITVTHAFDHRHGDGSLGH